MEKSIKVAIVITEGFADWEPILLHETEREVLEGSFHTGMASVVQFIGRKPSI